MTDRQRQRHLVLLYDGVCGACNWTVQTILRHDHHNAMRFAALQSEYGKAVASRHPELQQVDSLVLLEEANGEEAIFTHSAAALRVVSYLGGPWRLLLIGYIIPRAVRDAFYTLFARYRYRLFGKYESCPLPSPDVSSRFLDHA